MTVNKETHSGRKIIHIDMDCFYAAVEMRDNVELRGIPLAVGGASDRRGVISTCNYEARHFGIHSAMATAYALRLCPQLKVIPGRMSHYKFVSTQLRAIFERYTSIIEPLSLDEAFLDVSASTLFGGSATRIAADIRKTIKEELGLTASAGIAPNKFIAKICSDENKPNGQCVVTPEQVDDFVKQLSLKKIPGVGKVSAKRLARFNLHSCSDVREFGQTELTRQFGNLGDLLYRRSFGIDNRELSTKWIRKSMSVEHTFPCDIPDMCETIEPLKGLHEELLNRLKPYQHRIIRTQQVKLKFSDFKTTTVERQSKIVNAPVNAPVNVPINEALFLELLTIAWARGKGKSIRLLGIGVSFQDEFDQKNSDHQLALF